MASNIASEPTLAEEAPPPPEASSATTPPPEAEADGAVMSAVRAQLRAEGLQREAERIRLEQQQEAMRRAPPPPITIDEYVDQIPDLTEHKRGFLKAHPELLDPTRSRFMGARYTEALRSGIPDDTEEMDSWLLAAVERDVEQHVARAAQQPIQPRSEAPGAERTIQPAAPPEPPRRPSMPITAPVSRDVPVPSGQRAQNGVTLSPAEREIAVLSYRDLPASEAEKLYAMQKLKLVRERQAGRYPEHGQ